MEQTFRAVVKGGSPDNIDMAVAAIANHSGSNKIVTVRRITSCHQALSAGGVPAGNSPGTLVTRRITAHNGGTLLTATKHDSNNSLPSQVTARIDSTLTESSVLMYYNQRPNYRNNRVPHPQAFMLGATRCNGLQSGARINAQANESATTPIVLREGEGVALVPDSAGTAPQGMPQYICATITTTEANSPTYSYFARIECYHGNAYMSVMNGSGSGVVLHVKFVSCVDAGDDSNPAFQIYPIESILSGESITPTAFDSTNSALPAGVVVRGNASCVQYGTKHGFPPQPWGEINNKVYWEGSGVFSGFTQIVYLNSRWIHGGRFPSFCSFLPVPRGHYYWTQPTAAFQRKQEIFAGSLVLRETEGVGVFLTNIVEYNNATTAGMSVRPHYMNQHYFEIDFTVRDATPADKLVRAFASVG